MTAEVVGSAAGPGDVVERHRKLLSALVGNATSTGAPRCYAWPEALLPAPREEVAAAIGAVSDDPAWLHLRPQLPAMVELLERFSPDPRATTEFIASLLNRPILISFAYAVWLGVRGDAWAWLAAAAAFTVGWFGMLHAHFSLAPQGPGEGARLSVVRAVCVLLSSIGTISLSLQAVFDTAAGLYQWTFVQFDVGGLAVALLALWVGWYYSRTVGALYFFQRAALRPRPAFAPATDTPAPGAVSDYHWWFSDSNIVLAEAVRELSLALVDATPVAFDGDPTRTIPAGKAARIVAVAQRLADICAEAEGRSAPAENAGLHSLYLDALEGIAGEISPLRRATLTGDDSAARQACIRIGTFALSAQSLHERVMRRIIASFPPERQREAQADPRLAHLFG